MSIAALKKKTYLNLISKVLCFAVILVLYTTSVKAQMGTEFWFAPPEVTKDHNAPGGVPIYLMLSSMNDPSTVTISQPANAGFNGGVPIIVVLPPNSSNRVDLTPFVAALETRPTDQTLNTGLLVQATDTISAYYEVSNSNNNDIFALKGSNALGYEFYIPLNNNPNFYNHSFNNPGQHKAYASFDIVATENNTEIIIYTKTPVDGHPAYTPFTIILNKGQTYSCGWTGANYEDPATHPHGAVVVSDKPIAVTIKDDSCHNPSGGCYDLMGDQIVPIDVLGMEYIAIEGQLNGGGDESIFILATENNTKVYIDGNPVPTTTLFAGQTYQHNIDGAGTAYVQLSEKAYVTHVTGFGCEEGVALMVPIDCGGSKQVSFVRSTTEAFFLTIMVRAGAEDAFLVDGDPTLLQAADFNFVNGTANQWMSCIKQFNTTDIPVDVAKLITNTEEKFALGIINGGSSSGCRYGYFSEFITKVTVNAGVDQTICSDASATLAGTVEGDVTTGIWTTAGDGTFEDLSVLNTKYTPGDDDITDGWVELTLASISACAAADDKMIININAAPVLIIDVGKICLNSPTDFDDISTSGDPITGRLWDFDDGTTSPLQSPTHTFTDTGNYDITLTVQTALCSATDTLNITVQPLPDISVAPQEGCNPLSVDFTNNTGGSVYFTWEFGDGTDSHDESPSHTFVNTTTLDTVFNVRLIAESGYNCVDTIETPITVHPAPEVTLVANPSSGCSPLMPNFTLANNFDTDQYVWNFKDGTPTDTITSRRDTSHTFINTGSAIKYIDVSITAITQFGCIDSAKQFVTVRPKPDYTFTVLPDSACHLENIMFNAAPTGGFKYHWNFGDNDSIDSGPTINHMYSNTSTIAEDSTYTIQLITTTSNLCVDTVSGSVVIHPLPVAIFDVDTAQGCSPLEITITNTSGGTSYDWSFGDGNTSTTSAGSFTHTYNNTNSFIKGYDLDLTVNDANGCSNTVDTTINVFPNVTADFALSETIGCSPLSVGFNNQSSVSIGLRTYSWDFDDGNLSTNTDPFNIFTNTSGADTIFSIELVVKDSTSNLTCLDTISYDVTVHPTPEALFGIDKTSGCSPLDVEIVNSSTGVDTYTWDFNDGNTSDTSVAVFNHIYNNFTDTVKKYTLKLVTDNNFGCSDSVFQTVDVFPLATSSYTPDTTVGCSPLTVQFTNKSDTSITYEWTFGDGNTSPLKEPEHSFYNITNNSLTYTTQLVILSPYQCRDTSSIDIEVYPIPHAEIDIDDINGCSPLEVEITNTSTNATSYAWDFGNDSTSTTSASPFNYTYIDTTDTIINYALKLKALNIFGCADSLEQLIEVYPEVTAQFSTDTSKGCAPVMVQYTNESELAAAYSWNFGDGVVTSETDPAHNYTNLSNTAIIYNTSLIATSAYNCKDTLNIDISANPVPTANIIVDKVSGCSPLEIKIDNLSVDHDSLVWDFGNDSISYSLNPIINYSYIDTTDTIINYNLKLKTLNNFGCIDSTEKTFMVYPETKALFTPDTIRGCAPIDITFDNQSRMAKSFQWSFGDGMISLDTFPTHTYLNYSDTIKTYTTQLITSSSHNCVDTFRMDIKTNPVPTANIKVDKVSGCSPLEIDIENLSAGHDSLIWNFGNDSISYVLNSLIEYTYVDTTDTIINYTLKLKTLNSYGCADSTAQSFTVFPETKALYTPDTTQGCAPINITFNNESKLATSYYWSFGDGIISYDSLPTHEYSNTTNTSKTYTSRLITYSEYNCTDTLDIDITANPVPNANIKLDKINGCSPVTININNLSADYDSLVWNFGNDSTSTTSASPFNYTYIDTTDTIINYALQLKALNNFGCTDSVEQIIEVYPEVTALFSTDTTQGCAPVSVQFTNNSELAVNYYWNFGDGVVSTETDPLHNFANLTDTVVKYTSSLIATSAQSCKDTSELVVISANPLPKLKVNIDENDGCSPFNVEIVNNSTGVDTYAWDFGNDSTSNITDPLFYHPYENTTDTVVDYLLKVNVANIYGCADSTDQIIKIYPETEAKFSPDTIQGCSPLEIAFGNESTLATSYKWLFDDETISFDTIPTHVFSNYTDDIKIYAPRLITSSTYGCKDTTAAAEITIYPVPTAQFVLDKTEGCAPLILMIDNESTGMIDSCFWYMEDGAEYRLDNILPLSHSFTNGQLTSLPRQIKLVAANNYGCKHADSATVNVFATPVADFSTSDTVGCTPDTIVFTNLSTQANNYLWEFRDKDNLTSKLENPSFLYKNSSDDIIYPMVKLTATSPNGCNHSDSLEITIYPRPEANIILQKDNILSDQFRECSPLTLDVTNGTVGSVDSVYWDFGNDSISNTSLSNFQYTYTNNSIKNDRYRIKQYVENQYGCGDWDSTGYITIFPKVVAGFELDTTIGCPPLMIHFNDTSINGDISNWDFGEAVGNSSFIDPSQSFDNSSDTSNATYTITLTAESDEGCFNVDSKTVTVLPRPKADFRVTNAFAIYEDTLTHVLTNKTNGDWPYQWNFGDDTTSTEETPAPYHYEEWGEYLIQLIANPDGCSDTAYQQISLIPTDPQFEVFMKDTSGCVPFVIHFENLTKYANINSYHWYFDDGTESKEASPSHPFIEAKIHYVVLEATGADGDVHKEQFLIHAFRNPAANFKVASPVVYVPDDPAYFYDFSDYATKYTWDFGDGTLDSSDTPNPLHIYREVGVYDVSLYVTSKDGCQDSITIDNIVTAKTDCDLQFPNAFTPNIESGNGGSYDQGSIENDVFHPKHKGVQDYHLEIFNRWGELVFTSDDINIGWDGYYKERLSKQDVYVFKANWTCINGQARFKVGDVTLLHKRYED